MTCLNQELCIGDTEVDDLYEKNSLFSLPRTKTPRILDWKTNICDPCGDCWYT